MTNTELLQSVFNDEDGDGLERVHAYCHTRANAEQLARLLREHIDAGHPTAKAWIAVLEEMHPGIS